MPGPLFLTGRRERVKKFAKNEHEIPQLPPASIVAAAHLDQAAAGFVEKQQLGRNNYYINMPLVAQRPGDRLDQRISPASSRQA